MSRTAGGASIAIGQRRLGVGEAVFIIAEIGVNHNGDIGLAKQLIDAASWAGVDAVKFQTFKAEQIASAYAPKADYQLQTTNPSETQCEMLQTLALPYEAHRALQEYSEKRGLFFISTPFHEEGADFLMEMGVPFFKIGSGEITNFPFLKHVASYHKPIVLSTGMSYLSEVDQALRCIQQEGNDQVIILQCTSCYPADPAEANLRAMQTMGETFGVPIGYSDHSPGPEVVLGAVALSACIIEKHFTMDKNLPGPDHQASTEPKAFKEMVQSVRILESALGKHEKSPTPSEMPMRSLIRRSLTALQMIPAGTSITEDMIGVRRPGTGMEPALLSTILGRVTTQTINVDEPISWEHILI